jgi:uncharacterized membrane protein YeaQ/YmgE (transglycosylase-associated protein family)
MNSKYQPALLGGLLIGVLAGMPFVSIGNCCFCLWVVVGGVLVAYLRQQQPGPAPETADIVLGGLIAGVIGAVIASTLELALFQWTGPMMQRMMQNIIQSVPNFPEEARQQLDRSMQMGQQIKYAVFMQTLFFRIPCYAIVGLLGALLGHAIFKEKTAPPSLPPGVHLVE